MSVTLTDIQGAAQRINAFAHRTPVMTSSTFDDMTGRSCFFKCENLQKVGAFKFRGACNAIMQLPDDVASFGVVTHSSGNHAQAVALAGKLRSIAADIVMPRNASAIKKRAVLGYGATVHECEPNQSSREATAAKVVAQTGGTLIPPYDHPHIIAGQGTAALELLDEVGDLDAIIVPIGGGGIMAGTCIAAHGIDERIRIIGAEPAAADDAARSLQTGQRQPAVTSPDTICDGLLTGVGELTWPIIRDHVQRIVTVDDAATIAAMRFVWERMKLVIEPSAAVAVAVLLSESMRKMSDIRRIGVILTGGNVDLDHVPW